MAKKKEKDEKKKAKTKRSRTGRAKKLDKKVMKVEWKDKLAACSHLVIIVARVNQEFIKGDKPGYFKIWLNLEADGWIVTKRLRTDITGDVDRLYREKIELALLTYLSRGATKGPLPGYIDNLTYKDIKYDVKVKVDRG